MRPIRAIVIGSIGNLVEWYDFYAYAAFSLYFASSFFPSTDPVGQQLNTWILFAAAFVVRPIGGWLFGWMADRRGRRTSLTVSVLCMCAGSLLIAVTPSYASIGLAAPVLLGLARLIQGLSLGGEYGASATYLSEVADPQRRGYLSSYQYVTLIGGQLAAIAVLLVLHQFLTVEELRAWGWRIPFFVGAGLAVVAVVMRRGLDETDVFLASAARQTGRSALRELGRHPREVALVVGLTAGGTAAFYTFTTYMQTFLKLTVGLADETTTRVMAGTLIVASILQPIFGALSDRIGRKPLLIFFGVAGTLGTVPILTLLQATRSPIVAFVLISLAWLFVAAYTSISAIVKAELFPTSVRATGVGLPYALTVSIFGGTAPAVALWFKQAGHEAGFFYYLSGVIAFSLVVYVLMRDTLKHSAMIRSDGGV